MLFVIWFIKHDFLFGKKCIGIGTYSLFQFFRQEHFEEFNKTTNEFGRVHKLDGFQS